MTVDMFNEGFKRRLEENIELLDAMKIQELYKAVRVAYGTDLTLALKMAGINPLDYLSVIPNHYLHAQSLEDFVVPAHITKIDHDAFKWCSFNSFKFAPNSQCREVGHSFVGVGWYTTEPITFEFPESCVWIDAGCFANTHVDNIVLRCPTVVSFPTEFDDGYYPNYFVEKDSMTHDLLLETVSKEHIHFL